MADEISLSVDNGQVFKVTKDVLCKHSDYFRAMFLHFNERKEEISIPLLHSETMALILQYMTTGSTDLTECHMSTIGTLAADAYYLQIKGFIEQILNTIESRITPSNCTGLMSLAENCGIEYIFKFALLSFKSMKPEYIPDMTRLHWYLSHPYLNALNEIDVFMFGLHWVSEKRARSDAMLIILGCLDIEKLTLDDLSQMKICMEAFFNGSLAANVVNCLYKLAELDIDISVDSMKSGKNMLRNYCTERVYMETLNLVRESKSRLLTHTPIVPVWREDKLEFYTLTEKGFKHCFEFPEKIYPLYKEAEVAGNRDVVAWGPMKMVVFGATDNETKVKVYDVLTKKWTNHDINGNQNTKGSPKPDNESSHQNHINCICGRIIVDDCLYLLTLDSKISESSNSSDNSASPTPTSKKNFLTTIYDMRKKIYLKTIDCSLRNDDEKRKVPVCCAHEGAILCAKDGKIYKLKMETDIRGSCLIKEEEIFDTGRPVNCMVWFKGHVYFTSCQSEDKCYLYRFKPIMPSFDVSLLRCTEVIAVACLANPPASVCDLGNRLLFFGQRSDDLKKTTYLEVEEYYGASGETPKILWSQEMTDMTIKDVVNCCSLVTDVPALYPNTSNYAKNCLIKYLKCESMLP